MHPLLNAYLACLKKIKVVHSMPGRLRVNVFGVRQYPELARHYVPALQAQVATLSGVSGAEFNLHTGNLCLLYDPAKTSEAELLLWLNVAWGKIAEFAQYIDDSGLNDQTAIDAALRKMLATL